MTTRRAGLGRGLEALIPTDQTVEKSPAFRSVPVDRVTPNPEQPRNRFDDTGLEELAASMREVGVLQPIVVIMVDDSYQLIAGERRWRAAKRAGLSEIPAVIREVTGQSTLVEALVENLQREDLTPIEEARAFQQLLENYGISQEDIARRVGKSRPTISNTLRLLQLSEHVQALVDAGDLSAGHARALVGLEDGVYATHLADRAVKERWSVRQMEEAVKTRRELGGGSESRVKELRPVEIIELEKRLSDRLGAKVKISYRNEKGRLEIRFGSVEELERLYRAFIG